MAQRWQWRLDLGGRPLLTIYDLPVAVLIFAVIATLVHLASTITSPPPPEAQAIDLSPLKLPYYAFRSLVRMFLAYGLSLVFTFVYGSLMASSRRAEKVLGPLLDVLQSVPILGFLSVFVASLSVLMPNTALGFELSAILAIFTSQAWNMTYAFYQAVRSIPRDLQEAAKIMGLSRLQRFFKLEVPSAIVPLVWNTMMSFGGGFLFLSASEAITVLGRDIRLEGMGSYFATAVEQLDYQAIAWAIFAMIVLIALLDFFFFRPLLSWAQRYGQGSALEANYESAVLLALRRSRLASIIKDKLLVPSLNFLFFRMTRPPNLPVVAQSSRLQRTLLIPGLLLLVVLLAILLYQTALALNDMLKEISLEMVIRLTGLGFLTFLRVLACVVLSSAVWLPVSFYVALHPDFAMKLRPLLEFGASFPANLFFPLLVMAFLALGIPLTFGSAVLMFAANQWYIAFNVIAGAVSVPRDLAEASEAMGLSFAQKVKKLIFPCIFPYWVTGAITSAGGAWNVSIISETLQFGSQTLECEGLGAAFTQATTSNHWPTIILNIVLMSTFVILANRLLWRPLYNYAITRYGGET